MTQAVTEAEQEVCLGGGPIRDSIGPNNGYENSYNADGQKTLQKSIKPRVAPRRAMWPYWLMKKTSHTTQRWGVKMIPTDQKTGFLIGNWKIWSQADIAWPFQVNFSWFRGRKGSLISNNSAQSIKQLQLVLLIFSLVLCWPVCWTDSTISTRQRFLILKNINWTLVIYQIKVFVVRMKKEMMDVNLNLIGESLLRGARPRWGIFWDTGASPNFNHDVIVMSREIDLFWSICFQFQVWLIGFWGLPCELEQFCTL